jgi:hypothetical protein
VLYLVSDRAKALIKLAQKGFDCPSIPDRSCWIPGSYASILPEVLNSFLRPLKNRGFDEEGITKIGLYGIVNATTPESTKSLVRYIENRLDEAAKTTELVAKRHAKLSPVMQRQGRI